MDIEQGKEKGVTSTGGPPQQGVVAHYPPPQQAFQGVEGGPPKPVTGFPQPAGPPPPPQFYADGNQAGPGYPVSEGPPAVRDRDRLPCCGLGVGWFLFILGFILGIIPWYVGTVMLFCVKKEDYKREKPGYIACAIFAVIGTVLIIVELTTKYA